MFSWGKHGDKPCEVRTSVATILDRPDSIQEPGMWSLPKPTGSLNEDNVVLFADDGIAAVFDGLGGHANGPEASGLAASKLSQASYSLPAEGHRRGLALSLVEQLRGEMMLKRTIDGPRFGNADTTSVIAVRDGADVEIAWTGDSRCYLLDADNNVTLLTTDHDGSASYLDDESRRKMQDILDQCSSREDARRLGGPEAEHAFRTRNRIGATLSEGPISSLRLTPPAGSRLVLTSDGIHDNLTFAEISDICARSDREELAETLAVRAFDHATGQMSARAKADDTSVVVLDL